MDVAELDRNKFTFITFRAHVSEPQVFEDFIAYFLPHISSKFPFYIYSIENDDTPGRHIHLLLQHYESEHKFLKQKIEAKWFKDFKLRIKNKQTQLNCAFKYGSKSVTICRDEIFGFTMKLEEKMKCIGYIFKDITRRNKSCGLSQSLITKCCDFYFANRRIENATDKDWKIINNKNFHISCEQFAEQNNMTVHDYELIARMTHQRHSFQISAKDQEKYIAELRFANKNYDGKNNEFKIINKFQDSFKTDEESSYITYLQTLLKKHNIEYQGFYDNWYISPTTFDKKTRN